MKPDTAKRIFKEAAAILHGTTVSWWLSSGTVLGLIRENMSDAWLQHDTDWDVSIFGGDNERQLLLQLFRSAGFMVYRQYDKIGHPVQLCFEKEDVLVDFYFWRISKTEPDLLICDCEHGQMIKLSRFGLDRRLEYFNVLDCHVYLPSPVREYLFFRYGCDWHVPDGAKTPWNLRCPTLRKHRKD